VGWLDVTVLDLHGGKVRFYDGIPVCWAADELRRLLPWAARRQYNLIVRPGPNGPVLIQLNDLTGEMMDLLLPVAFLGLETSPGNFLVGRPARSRGR
jgi:hypothetical protein